MKYDKILVDMIDMNTYIRDYGTLTQNDALYDVTSYKRFEYFLEMDSTKTFEMIVERMPVADDADSMNQIIKTKTNTYNFEYSFVRPKNLINKLVGEKTDFFYKIDPSCFEDFYDDLTWLRLKHNN